MYNVDKYWNNPVDGSYLYSPKHGQPLLAPMWHGENLFAVDDKDDGKFVAVNHLLLQSSPIK